MVKRPKIAKAYPELQYIFSGQVIVSDVAVFTWDRIPVNEPGIVENIIN
ncbi:MAG: hypothetical protein AAGG51_09910 [Cyanobacteria bacterium P01_G01_bin.54]